MRTWWGVEVGSIPERTSTPSGSRAGSACRRARTLGPSHAVNGDKILRIGEFSGVVAGDACAGATGWARASARSSSAASRWP